MNHILFVMIVVILSTSMNAQTKRDQKIDKARKTTDDITKVLNLDKDISAKVFEIQTQKQLKLKSINKEFKNDKIQLKSKRQTLNKEF